MSLTVQPNLFDIGKNHRNHYLFSDHYLEVLRGSAEWKAVVERARALLPWLRERFADEGGNLEKYSESQLEDHWVRPILGQLGHVWEAQAQIPGLESGIKKPDYVLFPSEEARKAAVAALKTGTYARSALAAGEAKAWTIDLGKKTGNAPTFDNNNPMFQIDYYLRATGLAWGILSNGRFWRLVHKDSSYKLDVYFEIDLLRALTEPDESNALAVLAYFILFFGRPSFSADDHGRVFIDDALKGSRDYAVALESDLRDNAYKALEQIIIGFFAPSANKLDPANDADRERVYRNSLLLLYRLLFLFYGESRGLLPMGNPKYYERSLTALAKTTALEVDNHTIESLPPMTRQFWGRLQELFAVISGGDAALNAHLGVPRYNGGLFDPQRHAFLETHFVGDRHLVRALDYLARRRKSENGKFAGYETVDYRTLSERELGSVYEGMLEYKVSVAEERMVAVHSGSKETWIPAREKGKKKVIETKEPGELYLATDKGERKATGSYYTPDYIVKYIVEQTLGPLVEEARAAAKARAKEDAQRAPIADREERGRELGERYFVEAILALNVLDPAMGSGHFLVAATDYLARALATDAYTGAAEAAESDLTYWRRRVVEACIYGVDKNELAVELAKLSLWLVTAAADKPLSFLDHHLRHGDSLIGAWLKDLDAAPSPGKDKKKGKALATPAEPLFDESAFTTSAGLAVGGAARIEAILTDDLDAVHDKETIWADIHETHLGRWRRLADLWVSAYFGNAMSAGEYADLARRVQGKPGAQMSDEQAAVFLNHPAAANNDFFHWELEFPEVFFDQYGRPKGDAAGFDAVIGNPPYDELSEDALGREIVERPFLLSSPVFAAAATYRINLFRLFIAQALELTRASGRHSFIVPMSLLGDRFTLELRRHLLATCSFNVIEAFPQKDDPFDRVFFEAKLPTCLYVLDKEISDRPLSVRTHPGKDIRENSPRYQTSASEIVTLDPENAVIPLVGDSAWRLYKRLGEDSMLTTIGAVAQAMSGEVVFNQQFRTYLSDNPNHTLVLRGGHIQRYELQDEPKQGEPVYINMELWLSNAGPDSAAYAHKSPRVVYQESAAIDNWRRVIATFLPAGYVCGHTICYFKEIAYDPYAFLAVFNSQLLEWRFQLVSTTNHLSAYQIEVIPFPRFRPGTLGYGNEVPVRLEQSYDGPQFDTLPDKVLAFVGGVLGDPAKREGVQYVLSFLAKKMIEMREMRKTLVDSFWIDLEGASGDAVLYGELRERGKHEAGLATEAALAPYVRAESHATRSLDDSLAWDEEAFKAFVRALAGKVGNLSDLVKVYRKHAPAYKDLVTRIERTDWLIDQIVYKLYGLTDDEIAIVEGRAA